MADIVGRFGGGSRILPVRLITALLQALALYLLYSSAVAPVSWPATQPAVFLPLALVALLTPLVVLVGAGRMPVRWLAVWTVVAAASVAAAGYHAVMREPPGSKHVADAVNGAWVAAGSAMAAVLFVAHVLVTDSAAERRWRPAYARHFDTAWKQGLQLVLAGAFNAALWVVLWLGAGLFNLLKLDFMQRLIQHAWFAYPATTLAIALAIHATDVQPALIRGVRSIALTLFSSLLPVLTVLVLGFLGCLPFISLAPLWNTHFATELLLAAAFAQVFLINTCYQDGGEARTRSRVKRLAGSVAALELAPLTALAACALWLRVNQYGWTERRVLAAAAVCLAACHAAGYFVAALDRRAWLKPVEVANWLTAYVAIGLALALLSPLADPARVMVASQMGRLRAHAVAADQFDYASLRFDGARWGEAALETLRHQTEGPDAALISQRATAALEAKWRYQAPSAQPRPTREQLAERLEVYPPGHTLPDGLVDSLMPQADHSASLTCLLPHAAYKCIARFVRLDPDGPEAVLFLDINWGQLLQQNEAGKWRVTGRVYGTVACEALRDSALSDQMQTEPHTLPDIVAGGQRMVLMPLETPCPPARPRK